MTRGDPPESDLIGTWRPSPDDVRAQEVYGNVFLRFEPAGTLIYAIVGDQSIQKIFLSYRVEGG